MHGGISKITPRPSPRNSILSITPTTRPPSRSLPLPPAHTRSHLSNLGLIAGGAHSKMNTHTLQRLGSTSCSVTTTPWNRQNSLSSPYNRYSRNLNTNGFIKSKTVEADDISKDSILSTKPSESLQNAMVHSIPFAPSNNLNLSNRAKSAANNLNNNNIKQLRFIGIEDDLDKRRSASADLESMIEKLSRHKQFKMRSSRRKTLSTTNTSNSSNTISNGSNASNITNSTHSINTATDSGEDSCHSAASIISSINDMTITRRSITPELVNPLPNDTENNNDEKRSHSDDGSPEPSMHLQSILSQESLTDADINKVKKLSIGNLLPKDLSRLRVNTCTTDEASAEDEDEGFSMINDSDNDENVPINPFSTSVAESVADHDRDLSTRDHSARDLSTRDTISEVDRVLSLQVSLPPKYDTPLEQEDEDHLDDDDEETDDEDEDDMKEISPLTPKNHNRRYKIEMSDTSQHRMTLQIPTAASNSIHNLHHIHNGQNVVKEDRSLSVPPSFAKSRSLSPRQSFASLSRRSSSIFQMLTNQRASQIVSGISKEHIHKFHSVTHHDNEILLLSTKLLILLTVCVVSSFCSFLILFGIFRVNQNNGIFFVYGIDSFINIWCLAFTFKFSTKLYDMLFNCGNRHRSTKFCFPMVKTVALTWKFNFCFCRSDDRRLTVRVNGNRETNTYSNHLAVRGSESSRSEQAGTSPIEEKEERQCRISCFFCCGWGNEEAIQVYHMAKGEVELMLYENAEETIVT